MKTIRKYFKDWNVVRIIRLVLSLLLLGAYFNDRQPVFLMVSALLGMQAVLNISCPGGACATTAKPTQKQVMNIKKYEPKQN
jgi:F0F1-type ATP synthase assembly protein I